MDKIDDFLKRFEKVASSKDDDAFRSFMQKEIDILHKENDEWKRDYDTVLQYQNKGKELEHTGMLEEAAEQYEQAVLFGRGSERLRSNFYFQNIERLVIVYRKLKRYDDEIRTIRLGLSEDITDADRKKLNARLEKSIKLKDKQ